MTSEQDSPEPSQEPAPRRLSRRQLGGAVAIGAAVVWTSEFPFADAAIGQTLEPADGPTGPTGPTGTAAPTGATGPTTTPTTTATTATTVPGGPSGNAGASGASGAGGENLATTGMDPSTLGAVGAAAALAGGALVWLRRRGGDTPA